MQSIVGPDSFSLIITLLFFPPSWWNVKKQSVGAFLSAASELIEVNLWFAALASGAGRGYQQTGLTLSCGSFGFPPVSSNASSILPARTLNQALCFFAICLFFFSKCKILAFLCKPRTSLPPRACGWSSRQLPCRCWAPEETAGSTLSLTFSACLTQIYRLSWNGNWLNAWKLSTLLKSGDQFDQDLRWQCGRGENAECSFRRRFTMTWYVFFFFKGSGCACDPRFLQALIWWNGDFPPYIFPLVCSGYSCS